MQAIGIPKGTLTNDEQCELAKLLFKAGYKPWREEKEISGAKLKCICYEPMGKRKRRRVKNENCSRQKSDIRKS